MNEARDEVGAMSAEAEMCGPGPTRAAALVVRARYSRQRSRWLDSAAESTAVPRLRGTVLGDDAADAGESMPLVVRRGETALAARQVSEHQMEALRAAQAAGNLRLLAYATALESPDGTSELYEQAGDRLGLARHFAGMSRPALENASHRNITSSELGLHLCRELQDRVGEAAALLHIATARQAHAQRDLARASFVEAMELCAAIGDRLGTAYAALGVAHCAAEATAGSPAYIDPLEAARDVYWRMGNLPALVTADFRLGEEEEGRGAFRLAHRHFAHALVGYGLLGDTLGEAQTLNRLGSCERVLEEPSWSRIHHEHALRLYESADDAYGQANSHFNLGEALVDLGEHDEARRHLEEALVLHERSRRVVGQGLVRQALATLARARADYARAVRDDTSALRHFVSADDRFGQASALLGLGRSATALGDHEEAERCFAEAADHYSSVGSDYGVALCHEGLAAVCSALGQRADSAGHWARAAGLHEKCGLAAYAQRCRLEQEAEEG
jgi:tetratricopeptide (TPR) repeat protein